MMDYIRALKDELAKIKVESTSVAVAELAGFIRINSKILLTQGKQTLQLFTENASVARRILTFLKMFTDQIESSTVSSEKGKQIYQFNITDEYAIRDILHDTDFIDNNILSKNYVIDKKLVPDQNHVRAYIRGAFLAGGLVTDPNKSYHLEIQTDNLEMSESIKNELKKIGVISKVSNRRGKYFVYIKDSETIGDCLFNMGATNGYLKLQDIRVFKDIRNNINRIVNSETANINKTVKAAMDQIDDINYLIEKQVFSELSEDIQEIAKLRLDNPRSSLSEISRISEKYSRSAINYRLQKITDTANKLRGV